MAGRVPGAPAWAAGGAALLAVGLPPDPRPLAALAGLFCAALAIRLPSGDSRGSREAARAGALFGGFHALLVLHWLPAAGYPFLGWAALPAATVAWGLHAAVACGVAWIVHRTGVRGAVPFPFAFALGWAVLEWGPGALPVIGVPWLGPAAALVDRPRLLVPVGWIGSVGVGALAAAAAAALAEWAARPAWNPRAPSKGRGARWAAVLLVASVFTAGAARTSEPVGERGGALEILLVQIDLPLGAAADTGARGEATIAALRGLPVPGEGAGPAAEIWPEAPVPGSAGRSPLAARYRKEAQARARRTGRPLLFGAHVEIDGRLRNAALLADPEDLSRPVHGKRRLVPGVERTALGGAGMAGRGLAPGARPEPFSLREVRAGALVCFEVLFPAEAARLRRGGAGLLVQLTNDAPLRGGSGPFPIFRDAARRQHVEVLRLRAAELRLPAGRSALGGAAGAWDARGRPVPELDRWEAGDAVLIRYSVPPALRQPPAAWAAAAAGPGAAFALAGLLLGAAARARARWERGGG